MFKIARELKNKFKKGFISGFTLLELTVVLTIASIVLALGISAVGKVLQSKGDNLAEEHMDKVRTALERYKAGNGRYPCPAPINFQITADDFGQEASFASPVGNVCYRSPSVAYNNAQTLGTEGFVRVFDASATTDAQKWNKSVIIGAIPVQELGIDKKYATDKWGNKLVYAVTEKLAADTSGSTTSARDDATPYIPTLPSLSLPVLGAPGGADRLGAIVITDTVGNHIAPNADYVVISNGADGNGSFNANATAQGTCVTSGTGNLEKENCDFTNNIFTASGTYNKSENANYFFDLVRWDSFTSSDVNITGSTSIRNNLTIGGSSLPSGQNALVVKSGGAKLEDGSGASLVTVDTTGATFGAGTSGTAVTTINNALNATQGATFSGGTGTSISNPLSVSGTLTSTNSATFSGSGVNSNTLGVSGNSTLAALNSTNADIRVVNSTTSACTELGRLRYNTSNSKLEYCTASGWDHARPSVVIREALSGNAGGGYMTQSVCCNGGERLMGCAGARNSDLDDTGSEDNMGIIGVLAEGNCCRIAVDTDDDGGKMKVQAFCGY
jgi:prepilin-type N-terminal cleavage/methylation domain-containing protein